MKWKPGKRSGDIEDRRGAGGGFGGGGMPIPMGRLGGGGIGTLIAFAIVYFLFVQGGGGGGFNIPEPTNSFPQVPATGTGGNSVPGSPDEDREVQFVDFVQGDAQGFWTKQFQAAGKRYQRAKVVVFQGQVQSGCGLASSATGPFYCPLDRKVYLDLGFFRQLAVEFKAPGDFADAYVVAHELGHHVRTLTGITQQVDEAGPENPSLSNGL